VIGSGRALLRSTSAALACRNNRTRGARNVFGRDGLLGDGTRTGYLPHVRCYNVRRGRPHTHARTHALHTRMHTHTLTRTRARTHTHTRTQAYTRICIYSHAYLNTNHTRTHIRMHTNTYTHTHTHTHYVCLMERGLRRFSSFSF